MSQRVLIQAINPDAKGDESSSAYKIREVEILPKPGNTFSFRDQGISGDVNAEEVTPPHGSNLAIIVIHVTKERLAFMINQGSWAVTEPAHSQN